MVVADFYNRIFQKDNDGKAVLEELCRQFYDRPSYVKGDAYDTAFKEGQRSVVAFILHKSAVLVEDADNGNEVLR